MKLVVGLGNPGRKYAPTRHNLGFLVVDHLAGQNDLSIKKKTCDALIAAWWADGERVVLAKPQTFMNRSGEVVQALMAELRVSAADLVVICDDLDLPFGRIRIRPKGSAGGHRGLLSITEQLAGVSFTRIRIGIGRPPEGVDSADYVLQPFTPEEKAGLDEVINRAAAAVVSVLCDGARRAMDRYNRAP